MVRPMLAALFGGFKKFTFGLEENMSRNVSPFALHAISNLKNNYFKQF
jgi:hypothetical protein